MRLNIKKLNIAFLRHVIGICAVVLLFTIGMYAYLGAFSRYLADDYCEAGHTKSSSPIIAVMERYTEEAWPNARQSMRYSNLFFVGVSEMFGENNMQIVIPSMILLWVIGLTLNAHEIRKSLGIDWPFQIDLFLSGLLVFFSLRQAPNLFQTIYWRSAMMTHFAPLVFGAFLLAYLLKQARRAEDRSLSLPVHLFIFFATFVIAGFSEPPTTTILAAASLLMLTVVVLEKSPVKRRRYLTLLVLIFAGAFLGLMMMLFSPASNPLGHEKTTNIIELLMNSFLYSYLFIVDSLKTQPLPIFLSVLIPLMLIWLYQQTKMSVLSHEKKRAIWIVMIVIPFLAWLLIAAGFFPSVYGQSFPAERARFLARTITVAAFMLEGVLFGLLLGQAQIKPNRALGQWVVAVMFAMIAIVYPLRVAADIYSDVPEYRDRAALWDLREAFIIRHAGLGEKDIVIPSFPGVYQIKELDTDPAHWVNTCAAQYYGVNSIRAVDMPDEDILEYLNEK